MPTDGPAYYNENDLYAAEWLRNLITAGHIAPGDVDDRPIQEVTPDDVRGYTQCHFFAGIGGWSLALRLAGWPDSRPVWTGSCPCQPFSAAGRGDGFEDPRHLWPVFHRLIDECRPPQVFGEQVASPDGLQWLDAVWLSMEESGYAFGATDLCAASAGAPHIRQRLWFVGVADAMPAGRAAWGTGPGRGPAAGGGGVGRLADTQGSRGGSGLRDSGPGEERGLLASDHRSDGRLDHPQRPGLEGHRGAEDQDGGEGRLRPAPGPAPAAGEPRRVADAHQFRQQGERGSGGQEDLGAPQRGHSREVGEGGRCRTIHGGWGAADWLFCRDGSWRPVEPGSFPLADGVPARVGRLRAYGNAIVPQVAATFIRAVGEVIP